MNRALLVGINQYPAQPLEGCVQDVLDVAKYLEDRHDFAAGDITLLCDGRATKQAMVDALKLLISASGPGDHILFHYSGHGAQMPSADPNERDGYYETLCPVDFNWTAETALLDSDLNTILATVPADVSLTCVLDSCFSGGFAERALGWRKRFMTPPVDVAYTLRNRRRIIRRPRVLSPQTSLLMACGESETAADTSFDGHPNGAFTYFLLRAVEGLDPGGKSVREVIKTVAAHIAAFGMHPSVAGSPATLDAPFLGLSPAGVTNARGANGVPRGPSPDSEGTQAEDDLWRAVLDQITSLALFDREFRTRLEAVGGPLVADLDAAYAATRALRDRGTRRGGIACETFWWGFHLVIPSNILADFIVGATTVNDVVAAIGPVTGGAAPFVEAAAGFVALGLTTLKALDKGAGIYVSMSWFAPGMFVPTTVPARAMEVTASTLASLAGDPDTRDVPSA